MTIVTTTELAKAASLSVQRIYEYRREGMPQQARNKWDLEASLAWLDERRGTTVRQTDIEDERITNATIMAARHRLVMAQGDAQIRRNQLLDGVTAPVAKFMRLERERVSAELRVGDVWVSKGKSASDQHLRRELWDDLRREISGSLATLESALAAGEDVAATRIRYSGSMGG